MDNPQMHARFHHFAAAHFAMSAGYDPQRVHDMAQAMLALLGLALLWGLSRTWCSRVERRIVISSGESFWQVYRGLLWRESWRSFVVTAAIGVLFAFGGRDPEDAGQKIGSVIGLYPLLFIVIAVTAWSKTKQKLRAQP